MSVNGVHTRTDIVATTPSMVALISVAVAGVRWEKVSKRNEQFSATLMMVALPLVHATPEFTTDSPPFCTPCRIVRGMIASLPVRTAMLTSSFVGDCTKMPRGLLASTNTLPVKPTPVLDKT